LRAFSKEIELQAQEKAQEMETIPKPWRQSKRRPRKQLQVTLISKKEIKKENIDNAKGSK
jgi:hypothetical protein